jgi:hypothetical protein
VKHIIHKSLQIIVLAVFISVHTFSFQVFAASLTNLSDAMSSVKVNALSNHDIQFTTPTGITTGQTITVTFPSGFSMESSLSYTDVDVLVGGVQQTLAASNGASTWGVVRTSATVLTITAQSSGTPAAASSVIRIKIGTNATNQSTGVYRVTNDSSTGQKSIAIGGSMADSGSISVTLITDDTVAVSATVQQSISFAINANSIAFGTLDSGAARYANTSSGSGSDTVAHTLAVGTNAPSGYTVTVQGATLTSAQNSSNTITAIGGTPATSNPGTEQFGIYATKSGGVNGTIAAPYATASSFGYDATATTATTFASGTTATATETYSLHYLANIAAVTEAGNYSANLTYVATANF